VELWNGVFTRFIDPGADVLDLGSGIGTYSELLADLLDAQVVGVEPSARMRAIAEREHAHPRVAYVDGSAERIPLPDESRDAALLSYVIHHVDDPEACAAELSRVLRPGGLILLRGTLRESLPRVPLFDYFPTARPIAERQMPSLGEVMASFAGFEPAAEETIEQETAPSLRAYHERMKLRAISTLELIEDADFERGFERLRLAAERETEPRPVVEPVNLVVFRRP
jgi:ubiquinone/menaquinone biosynthesis C-methylase UbiE